MDAGRRLRGALAAPVNKDRSESAESSHKLPMPSGDLRAHRSYVLRNVIYKLQSCSACRSSSAYSGTPGAANRLWIGSTAWVIPDLFRANGHRPVSHRRGRFEANPGGRYREGKEVAGRSKKAAKPVSRHSRSAAATSYDQWARRTLAADTELAAEYLREVVEHSDTPEELLLGLRRIAEAQGMSRVAEAAGLSRESLYRSLSAAGNPRLSTLVAVLRVAGLKLSVRPAA